MAKNKNNKPKANRGKAGATDSSNSAMRSIDKRNMQMSLKDEDNGLK